MVEQLEESRQRLSKLVDKLEEMRERDLKLNVQLKDNIAQLNQEISDREKAEAERQATLEQLKVEMKEREVTQIQLEQQSSFLRSFWMLRRIWCSTVTKIKSFPAVTGRWNS